MIRESLSQKVTAALGRLAAAGTIPAAEYGDPEIADTKQPEHGDYACNIAMAASRLAGMNPRQFGEALAAAFQSDPDLDSVEVAGPGFLNFRLKPAFAASFVPKFLELGDGLKQSGEPGSGLKINVEFVSVNPNGPITIGSGRGAAYGSALCNVLEAAGHSVWREYYINDGVNSEQMRLFAESVRCLSLGQPVPENGYKGDYVQAVVESLVRDYAIQRISDESPELAELCAGGGILGGFKDSEFWDNLLKLAEHPRFARFVKQNAQESLSLAAKLRRIHLDTSLIARALPPQTEYYLGLSHFLIHKVAEDHNVIPAHVKSHHYRKFSAEYDQWFTTIAQSGEIPRLSGDAALAYWYQQVVAMKGIQLLWDVSVQGAVIEDRSRFLDELGRKPTVEIQTLAEREMIASQRSDLSVFGVEFDCWFSEQSLHDSGLVAEEVAALRSSGVADERPLRTILKMGKKGVIEDVTLEAQVTPVEEEVGANGVPPLPAARGARGEEGAPADSGSTLWLRSTKFGDDQDRVLRRRDGRLTYIASDVAYHKDKFNRPAGADKLITILGPDHHGYIGRLQAVVAAMLVAEGLPVPPLAAPRGARGEETHTPTLELTDQEARIYASPEERDTCRAALELAKQKLEVQIFQLVRFMKDGKPAPMRKRDGNIYAIIDLINEIGQACAPEASQEEKQRIGRDVARFFYLSRSHDTTFDFDLDLAQKQSDENPVFYVQYAHARICSVIEKARAEGLTADLSQVSKLEHPKEQALIRKIADLPWEVARCAEDYGVHRLTTYGLELARTYHHFYDACRVINQEDPETSQARLALCEASRVALRNVFDLLGLSAPERM